MAMLNNQMVRCLSCIQELHRKKLLRFLASKNDHNTSTEDFQQRWQGQPIINKGVSKMGFTIFHQLIRRENKRTDLQQWDIQYIILCFVGDNKSQNGRGTTRALVPLLKQSIAMHFGVPRRSFTEPISINDRANRVLGGHSYFRSPFLTFSVPIAEIASRNLLQNPD